MKRLIKKVLGQLGYEITARTSEESSGISTLTDLSEEDRSILTKAQPFTMTSIHRMASLIESVKFVSKNGIAGDVVECGVWRGGSMMIIASTLVSLGDTSRSLYLYDTYEGMPPPTDDDCDYAGIGADEQLATTPKGEGVWCEASIESVKKNVLSTGYPPEHIHFIKGKVEDTIPQKDPLQIALLRLDTDWYSSTKHELDHLYPRLEENGILIIDDYGYWQGAKKAVDEYFADSQLFLHRIDNTGRLMVKGPA